MEPEGSLPHSQASATRPYPGLAQSSPHTHNPPPADPLLHLVGCLYYLYFIICF